VEAGATFVVPDAQIPYELTVPASSATAAVSQHASNQVSLTGDQDGTVTVTILLPDSGALEPCTRSDRSAPLESGVDGAVAYLEALAPPVTVTPVESVEVAGVAARSFRIEADDSCRGPSLFSVPGATGPAYGGSGRYSILEPVRGQTVVVIVSGAADPAPEAMAWADELLDSIRFGSATAPSP
jgi:hypothetical protein